MDDAQPLRWEIEPLERRRRGLDDRMLLLVPSLGRRLRAATARLPAGSRRRRAALTRAVRTGYAATNRDDYEVLRASLHPDVEFIPPEGGGLGFDGVYRGPEGVERFIRQWKEGFVGFRYEPYEIADAGGGSFAVRLGMIWTLPGGAEASDEYGIVITLEDGLVRHQESFVEWDDALGTLSGAPRPAG